MCYGTGSMRIMRGSGLGIPCVMASKSVMKFVSLTVFCSVVLTACGGGAANTQADVETSIATSLTLPPLSIEDLALAKTNWQQTNGVVDENFVNGGVGVSEGKIFGVLADKNTGVISVWNWIDNQFVKGIEIPLLEGRSNLYGLGNAQISDFTGDGNDDFIVQYAINSPEAKVFSQVAQVWTSLRFDASSFALEVVGSDLVSKQKVCLPSCAEGPRIPITYKWDGSEFKGRSVDQFGNEFSMLIGPTCSTFTNKDYEPFKMCDKGDGVRYLQKVLHSSGLLYSSSPNGVDGYFGPEMEYSIKVFQFVNGLPVTGIVEGQWYHDLIENYNLSNGYGD